MKEASYEDAVALGEQLNLHKDDIWSIIRGVRYSTLSDLGLLVHEALKSTKPAVLHPGEDRQRGA